MFAALKRDRGPSTVWRWPAWWAFVLAFVLQLTFGLVASMISFVLLVAADPTRCPVAVGGQSMRAFCAWCAGVVVGIVVCEHYTTAQHSANGNWVFWGATTEIWRHFHHRSRKDNWARS